MCPVFTRHLKTGHLNNRLVPETDKSPRLHLIFCGYFLLSSPNLTFLCINKWTIEWFLTLLSLTIPSFQGAPLFVCLYSVIVYFFSTHCSFCNSTLSPLQQNNSREVSRTYFTISHHLRYPCHVLLMFRLEPTVCVGILYTKTTCDMLQQVYLIPRNLSRNRKHWLPQINLREN